MWFKLCLLLIYITFLFILARFVEALTWYETGSLSRRLLDPMTLSVAKLKALLEQRGVSYEAVVEKGDLTQLVDASGSVHEDEVDLLQASDAEDSPNTNFTSGAHFFERVEDAKDGVWLVQVLASHQIHHNTLLSESTWKSIRKKVNKFGVNTGILDCDLDPWWCERRGWRTSHLLLALPQVYRQKANVAIHTYPGPLRHTALQRWMRQMLQEKIETVRDFRKFKDEWLHFKNGWQDSEVRAVLMTDQEIIPMFFSALSVKFPGRVKFGVAKPGNKSMQKWTQALATDVNYSLPLYLITTSERAFIYGQNQGDCLSFASMETLLKFLHPCLNDVFIFSFLIANLISVLEFVTAQGSVIRRFRKCLWCVVKLNAAVVMLWLPLIAIFQLPYLDNVPLLGLKFSRKLATSSLGEAFRRDVFFYSQHTFALGASFLLACMAFGLLAYKMTGGRYEDDDEPYFNFAQMRTLTHLRSNEFFEPMSIGGYDLTGGMEIFGSRLSLPTMSLQPVVSSQYINLLPTWPYGVSLNIHTPNSEDQDVEGTGKLPPKLDSPTSSSEFANTSPNDLLDGNYHCECPDHKGMHSFSSTPSQSALNQNDNFSGELASSSLVPRTSGPVFPQRPGTEKEGCPQCLNKDFHNPDSSAAVSKCLPSQEKCNEVSTCGSQQDSSVAEDADFPENYLSCSQCVICIEEFSVGVTLCGLPCGHVFHHSCILTWLRRDHHFCPVCRWPSFRPRPALSHEHAE